MIASHKVLWNTFGRNSDKKLIRPKIFTLLLS